MKKIETFDGGVGQRGKINVGFENEEGKRGFE